MNNYRLVKRPGGKAGSSMKGYNDKRRRLFVRITASVLAALMVITVFSVLIFR